MSTKSCKSDWSEEGLKKIRRLEDALRVAIEDNQEMMKVANIKSFGHDLFRLISTASSKQEGWMKSTKAMDAGGGVVVQVTTQKRNPDGSYSLAEALTFVPDSVLNTDKKGCLFIQGND